MDEQPADSNRFRREIGPREVALVEDEIDHVQHARQALRKIGQGRYFIGNARITDLRLCADDALRERRRGGEERSGHLLGRQPAYLAARLAQPVDRLESASGDEPRARIRRHAFDRPALHRRRKRILQRLLGEVEVAEEADQGGQDAAGFGAVDRLDRVYGWLNSMIGRTSTVPCCAPGIREATWTASFKSFALIR